MKHLENSRVIQAHVEGMTLQQLALRNELMENHGLSHADATAVIRGQKSAGTFGITDPRYFHP